MPAIEQSASELVSSARRRAPKSVRSRAEALQRMAAHVEAERFLLEGQRCGLGPRPAHRQRRDRGVCARTVVDSVVAAEQLDLALIAIALMAAAVVEDAIEAGEQARRHARERLAIVAGRERVERAGLDQALEHLLVHEPQIDVLGRAKSESMRAERRCASRGSTAIAPSPAPLTAPRPNRTPSGCDDERRARWR